MKEILDEHLLEEKPKKHIYKIWFYIALAILLGVTIFSAISAWIEISSIIGTAPVISGLGILFSLFALRVKNKICILVGLIPVVISLFWFGIVLLFSLSPEDCEFIIPMSLSIATAVMLCLGIFSLIDKETRNGIFKSKT